MILTVKFRLTVIFFEKLCLRFKKFTTFAR